MGNVEDYIGASTAEEGKTFGKEEDCYIIVTESEQKVCRLEIFDFERYCSSTQYIQSSSYIAN